MNKKLHRFVTTQTKTLIYTTWMISSRSSAVCGELLLKYGLSMNGAGLCVTVSLRSGCGLSLLGNVTSRLAPDDNSSRSLLLRHFIRRFWNQIFTCQHTYFIVFHARYSLGIQRFPLHLPSKSNGSIVTTDKNTCFLLWPQSLHTHFALIRTSYRLPPEELIITVSKWNVSASTPHITIIHNVQEHDRHSKEWLRILIIYC